MRTTSSIAFVVACALAACTAFDGAEELLGKGGGGATTTASAASSTVTTTATASSSSGDPCMGAPNEVCEADKGESCACSDCEDRLPCNPFGCDHDGICTTADHCICPDCDHHGFCYGPQKADCNDDGECSNNESCQCNDCIDRPECADNLAACEGGMPNAVCNAAIESCTCPDCAWTAACLVDSCSNDGMCLPSYGEACFCPDCVGDGFCACDPPLDGLCNAFSEGCGCTECNSIPQCN